MSCYTPEQVPVVLDDRQGGSRPSTAGSARWPRPAIATATLGRSAPVAIDVAIAFAVSWKPFVKLKTKAVITTTGAGS